MKDERGSNKEDGGSGEISFIDAYVWISDHREAIYAAESLASGQVAAIGMGHGK